MKIVSLSIILFCLLIQACTSEQGKSAQKVLAENQMDFTEFINESYFDIKFQIPVHFKTIYDQSFVIKKNALLKNIEELYLNFSVECFNKSEAENFKRAFNSEIDLLNAVHDNYLQIRKKSLTNSWPSIKKELKGMNGLFQSIEGDNHNNGNFSSYFMVTVEVKNRFYVFQMIGNRENMGYLYDDFMKIVSSVK
jgi:hypothetical protein